MKNCNKKINKIVTNGSCPINNKAVYYHHGIAKEQNPLNLPRI